MKLNDIWTQRIKDKGADFVYFVNASVFPADVVQEYTCAVLFGKMLSKEYINDIISVEKPKRNEVISFERKMDALADKSAEWLNTDG
ncbi:MAG: hypothetical protein RR580_07530, partial [Christensenellaceae bacterium]